MKRTEAGVVRCFVGFGGQDLENELEKSNKP